MNASPAIRDAQEATPPDPLVRRALVAAGLAALIVVTVYIWFVSVGYWTWWPKTTYTYDLLGSAFRGGQVALQLTPDPGLLALPDPYDPAARAGMQYPWDSSLFNGRYYLYWGPTPGLLLAIVKLAYSGQIADQYLVFAFVLAIFLFSMLLLLAIWRRYFLAEVPSGVLFLSLLGLGLAGPPTWILNRPAGYEAAISAGQAFLVGGLYFAVASVLRQRASKGRLILAGIFWALALGSRISTILPIVLLGLGIILKLWRQARGATWLPSALAALGTPLVIGGAALGWYNWVRFGSPVEFGLRYQLTLLNMRAAYGQIFSARYVADNLYNYLFNPVGLERIFPFLVPLMPARLPPGPALSVPTTDLEPVTGLLLSAPFLIYALLPALASLRTDRPANATSLAGSIQSAPRSPTWLYLGLSAAAVASSVFILMYFYPTMRQLEDVVPTLALLAVLGFWEGWRSLRKLRIPQALFVILALGLILLSIVASGLLAVTSYENRFQHLNRDLLRELVKFFGR